MESGSPATSLSLSPNSFTCLFWAPWYSLKMPSKFQPQVPLHLHCLLCLRWSFPRSPRAHTFPWFLLTHLLIREVFPDCPLQNSDKAPSFSRTYPQFSPLHYTYHPNTVCIYLLTYCLSSLSRMKALWGILRSLMYLQCPGKCLTCNMCSVSTCFMNKWYFKNKYMYTERKPGSSYEEVDTLIIHRLWDYGDFIFFVLYFFCMLIMNIKDKTKQKKPCEQCLKYKGKRTEI